jgi:hypothetical protein
MASKDTLAQFVDINAHLGVTSSLFPGLQFT